MGILLLGATPTPTGWQQLKVGAGGLQTGVSIASDGTYIVQTDTYGAYIWDTTATTPQGNAGGVGAWRLLVSSSTMPSDLVASYLLYGTGVYASAIAPSNSSVIYMVYPVLISGATFPGSVGVYTSNNKGATFTKSGFTPVGRGDNDANDGSFRFWGPRMAVDPSDANICYIGTGSSGLFKTSNGGTSWSQLTNFPTAASPPGITGLVVQPGTTGATAVLFGYSFGNGIYKSTDGGANWSQVNSGSGPTNAVTATISSSGTYYVIDSNSELWTYTGTTWTKRLTAGNGPVRGIAVDPSNASRAIAATYNGLLNETTNNGGTWSGWANSSVVAATDIPWQANAFTGPDALGLNFDRIISNKLLINGDTNFWTTTLSGSVTTGTNVTWNSQGVGIEQIVANEIVCVQGNKPLLGGWDWDTFNITDLTKYPLTHGATGNVWTQLSSGWSIDYASTNTSFIVKNADEVFLGGRQNSGFSADGGISWTNFPALPPGTVTTGGAGNAAGNIAAVSTTAFIFASANGVQPFYTLNAGSNWTGIVLPGSPAWTNFIGPYYKKTRMVCADRVAANTYYLLLTGSGIYRSTDSAQNWSLRSTAVSTYGAAGKLYCAPNFPGVSAGDLWLASGPGDFTSGAAPIGGFIKFSIDGGANWTDTTIFEGLGIGFCAPKPGNTYPSVGTYGYNYITSATNNQSIGTGTKTFTVAAGLAYFTNGVSVMLCDHANSGNRIVGTVSSYAGTTLQISVLTVTGSGTPTSWDIYTQGFWVSDDHGSTWALLGQYTYGNLDYIVTIAGDPVTYNKWYVGFQGSGYAYYGP